MALRPTFVSLLSAAALLSACGQTVSDDATQPDDAPADVSPASATNEDAANGGTDATPAAAPDAEDIRFEIESDHAIGDPDAPVTVIEYASVTCVVCEMFHEEAFDGIKERYIETGQVRFVFRELPTAPAGLAVAGFLLASCQPDDDAYFEMIDVLFRQRTALLEAARSEGGARSAFVRLAATAGLTEAEFDACLADEDELARIERVVQRGASELGIAATPSFVINGEVVTGIRTLRDFEAAVDPLLDAADE